jgi:hypothetical protein
LKNAESELDLFFMQVGLKRGGRFLLEPQPRQSASTGSRLLFVRVAINTARGAQITRHRWAGTRTGGAKKNCGRHRRARSRPAAGGGCRRRGSPPKKRRAAFPLPCVSIFCGISPRQSDFTGARYRPDHAR